MCTCLAVEFNQQSLFRIVTSYLDVYRENRMKPETWREVAENVGSSSTVTAKPCKTNVYFSLISLFNLALDTNWNYNTLDMPH